MSDWVDYPEGSEDEWVDFPEEKPLPKKAKQPKPKGDWIDYLNGLGSSVVQGIPFTDEIDAGVSGIGSLLGGRGFSAGYDERLNAARQEYKNFGEENPGTAVTAEVVGSLPMMFLPGGQAKTLGGMVKAGAVYGGLTGFGKGEGDLGNRLGTGAVGLATGAAVPIGIKGVTGTGKAINQAFARSPIAQTVANEAGAILPKAGAAPLTKAEATIFQRLRNVPTDQLTAMQDEMARALTEGTPLYLPEAGGKYGKKKLFDFASYIANREGGASFAEKAIGERAEQAGPRISSILDELSPQSDPRMGGFSLMDAVKGKVDELKEIRAKAAEPYYDRAFSESPSIDPQELSRFMSGNGVIKGIVRDLRELPQWHNAADNSRELMHRAKVQLDEMLAAEDMLPSRKAELTQIKNNLVDLLEQVDLPQGANLPLEIARTVENATKPAAGPSAYGAGRATFADKSAPIDEIMKGPLGGFLQANASPENVGTSVLNMSPSAIEIGIGQLGSADAMRTAARSGISKRIGSRSDTANLAEALIGRENPRKTLSTLMGPDGADNILRRLELEDRMAKGKNLYQRGSTTARNLLEEETFNKSGAVVDRLLKALASPKGALFQTVGDLKNLGLASGKDDLARALAGILFDTQQGSQSLEKIIPYAMRRNEIASQYDNLAAALTRGTRPLVNRAIPSPQSE